ncbi:MAG: short-chain dehydrogenase [Fibrobacteres bacterium CG2_30_45_31]|nr:MAG: short-chain dehydrogenase [Fibrobacteres bacterium CG2_30_45_31]
MNRTDVEGKWTLVTGASRGVGREIAKGMAALGANLILQSRKKEHTESLMHEIGAMGVNVHVVVCDLDREDSVKKMLAEIDGLNVPVDIVFNNAGVQVPWHTDYFEATRDEFLFAFAVNCLAPIEIAYHFLPQMMKRGFGRILMTTSGIADQPELMGYACSKAALTKFVQDFACKLNGTDVMMNSMDPGWLRTDLGGDQAPNAVESVVPGALVGVLLNDKKSGRWFNAQDYVGLSIEDALAKV